VTLDAKCGGLKIRVSVVRFRPWPPFRLATYVHYDTVQAGDVSIWVLGSGSAYKILSGPLKGKTVDVVTQSRADSTDASAS
jgi:hypothetical protein